MNYSAKQWVRVLLQCSACGSGFIAFVFAALNYAVTASVTMKTSLGSMEIELYGIAVPGHGHGSDFFEARRRGLL
jgi:hypothetical protein